MATSIVRSSQVFERQALPKLADIEGGYVMDPDDPGGETNHGITIKVARAYGWKGPMVDLTYGTAKRIYKQRFWDPMGLDDIAKLSPPIAVELFESAVHVPINLPGLWLQKWLNAFNRDEKLWEDIAEDGIIGYITMATLSAYLRYRGDDGTRVMVAALNADQAIYYRERQREKYVYGWLRWRVVQEP